MNKIAFKHTMAAHCESGTVTAQLNFNGLKISEPMVFGLASGIFFGYFKTKSFPFPTFVVRNKPGDIRKNISKQLGVKFKTAKFKNPEKGMQELDRLLDLGIPVSCQSDFFYMDYLPDHVRVHINVHFITVVSKEGDNYIVSDSYSPVLAKLDRASLEKARFAGGSFSPKGFLFYTQSIPERIDMEKAIKKAIKKAAFYMIKLPMPFLGIKGIRLFSKKISDWPELARDIEHLSHEIMKINVLLEDQGTGGAGFRFMYATFLREASEVLNNPDLLDMSKRIMEIGDNWRRVSLFAARIGKKRDLGKEKLLELGQMINDRADEEEVFFNDLLQLSKSL